MRVVSLGSGSSGNALVAQAGPTAVLLDAGFPVRTLVSRLRQVSLAPRTDQRHSADPRASRPLLRRGRLRPPLRRPADLRSAHARRCAGRPARGQTEPRRAVSSGSSLPSVRQQRWARCGAQLPRLARCRGAVWLRRLVWRVAAVLHHRHRHGRRADDRGDGGVEPADDRVEPRPRPPARMAPTPGI